MVSMVNIEGYRDFLDFMQSIDPDDKPVYVYFSGSKNDDGESWCPDCVVAEPVVKGFVSELKQPLIFVYVDVGDRDYWKDKRCPFREDTLTKLMVIPTLIKLKGVKRLEGSQCANKDLLHLMFDEDD